MHSLGTPRTHHQSSYRKGKMAAWPVPGLWKISGSTLFQMTLVAALLDTVLGDCGLPPKLPFASPFIQLYDTSFKTGTILKYACHPGYRRVNSSHLTCGTYGAWIYSIFCIKKQCRNPGELTNGKVEVMTDLLFGSTIQFSCSKGYILVGSTTSQCELQGRELDWSDPLPECVTVKCESPPEIRNGKHSGGDEELYTYGSSVTYSCDPNFSLIGNASIYCSVVNKTVGIWSPSPPICKNVFFYAPVEMVCHQPHIPKGIFISGFKAFYNHKDSIAISCKKGYILRGSNLIHCETNNEWYPAVPTCEPNGCTDLPEIPGVFLEKSIYIQKGQELFEIGTKLKYQCKPGYRPLPDETLVVTCQHNLMWSTSKGCERVCCPTPNLDKIRIIRERRDFTGICVYAYGDYIFYMCDEGYYPISSEGRSSCQVDGTWKPRMPACLPVLCPRPMIRNARLFRDKDHYHELENVTIQCDFGYYVVGPKRITCSEKRTWYPEIPKCKKEVPEGCDHVRIGRKLMQCLPNPDDVKLALEVYKLSLEIEHLERQKDRCIKIREDYFEREKLEESILPLN